MKMPKDKIQIWIDELRSGKWEQTRGKLQRDDRFCCFGVGCKLFVPRNKQNTTFDDSLSGFNPADQEFSPKWLLRINDDFANRTGPSLINLNDEGHWTYRGQSLGRFTFDEIADLLQAVYIEEVL